MDDNDNEDRRQSEKKLKASHSRERGSTIIYIYTINVEVPSGLKIQVKYREDMFIRDLLHQICHRISLDPNDHFLTFHNRELSVDMSCKEAGLFPNGTLKLFKGRKSRSENVDIHVSIQVKDVRFASVFCSLDNLWHIVTRLCAKDTFDKTMVPIVIFMKQEFIGKKVMKTVTLRDLGITRGTCFLRFLQLKQEDLDQRKMKDDNVSQGTLESLELIASGPATDVGARTVQFSPYVEAKASSVMCIGGRSAVLFDQPQALDIQEALHDEFFDTTIEEVQFMFHEVKKSSEELVNLEEEEKQVREHLEKIKQKKAYQDETVIRIYFPNGQVLQAMFAPEETIEDVKIYIKTFLQYEHEFQLFLKQTKAEPLSLNLRLDELGLVPIGKLYFDHSGEAMEQYFAADLIPRIGTYENAAEAALSVRGQSLMKFINYTPTYESSFVDKVIDFILLVINWFTKSDQMHVAKRNPIAPKWLKTELSRDSLDDNTERRMTSFGGSVMEDSMDETDGDVSEWGPPKKMSHFHKKGSDGKKKKTFDEDHESTFDKEKAFRKSSPRKFTAIFKKGRSE
ncbi:uncharacterized protein LOC106663885 isoform X1 [Cimex lectularius]|uniref:UBX domain-containing protein n=2 Tax=Cimex lectularius TaxID=79782 RepID=A0A8I6RFZ7_CIMLE|nr:uncharacterized protein LOC106663885 isoform X1 [Cimex lectularius]